MARYRASCSGDGRSTMRRVAWWTGEIPWRISTSPCIHRAGALRQAARNQQWAEPRPQTYGITKKQQMVPGLQTFPEGGEPGEVTRKKADNHWAEIKSGKVAYRMESSKAAARWMRVMRSPLTTARRPQRDHTASQARVARVRAIAGNFRLARRRTAIGALIRQTAHGFGARRAVRSEPCSRPRCDTLWRHPPGRAHRRCT